MGGASQTGKFARFFVAPGVGHRGGGQGAAPTGLLDAVVRWVERGQAPEKLTRPAHQLNPQPTYW